MPVITISRQFGTAGVPIARELAKRFGAEFLDREIVAAVAERSGIPEAEAEGYDERLPSLWQRLASALATSAPEVAMPPLPADVVPASAMHERLAAITRAVIEEAATRGNAIIVGRGGVFILGRRPDTLHVQLHASLDARVRYLLMRIEEVPVDTRPDEDSLRQLCRSIDSARQGYVRRLFEADWLHVSHYDLSIDSGRLGVEQTADIIESAARHDPPGSPGVPA
ncbi:MAG TPA: cytidylate kinase-like family protein [Candidatus Limnocylindrales bacterium]|nr:cytidylate kinase-like family protein [Candidatus Limnocylindrales bacterium]